MIGRLGFYIILKKDADGKLQEAKIFSSLERTQAGLLMDGPKVTLTDNGENGIILSNSWQKLSIRKTGFLEPKLIGDLGEIPAEALDLIPFKEKREMSGFKVGGRNTNETLASLLDINRIRVEELESRMYSGMGQTGYLSKERKSKMTHTQSHLLEVLMEDNKTVLDSGLTHAQLELPLLKIDALYKKGFFAQNQRTSLRYNQKLVSFEITQHRGSEYSPFKDGTRGDYNLELWFEKDGGMTSLLGAELIRRYGFYQDVGMPYRMDPATLIRGFGLKN